MLCLVIDGLRTGVAWREGGPYTWAPKVERGKNPMKYWILMGMYAASALFGAILLAVFLLPGH
jgi:hypothetical protein